MTMKFNSCINPAKIVPKMLLLFVAYLKIIPNNGTKGRTLLLSKFFFFLA